MKVKIQISTSTKNSTVNAVGNLNRRLGLPVVSPALSGLVCVPAVMTPGPGVLPASGSWLGGLLSASSAHPWLRIANLDSCSLSGPAVTASPLHG